MHLHRTLIYVLIPPSTKKYVWIIRAKPQPEESIVVTWFMPGNPFKMVLDGLSFLVVNPNDAIFACSCE